MYKYVLNYVVKISMMFAKYFKYYTIILGGGRFFVDTLYINCMLGFPTYFIFLYYFSLLTYFRKFSFEARVSK